jgi:CNT family concentrative nucleoside transporter
MQTLISIIGIIALLAVAFLASENRKAINYRTVGLAFLLQFTLGAFVIYTSVGQAVIFSMAESVSTVIGYSKDGMSFMFGGLVSDKMYELFGPGGFVIAFQVLPIIVFFSALSAVLYYLGVMPWVVKWVGGGLQRLLKTSKAESMSASANIFLGVSEAPLLIKPYIPKMTRAELFAVMCGGLASIAGTMLAGYAQLGIKMEYLLAASFMAAPGGLLFAKLLIPQTEPVCDDNLAIVEEAKPSNIIDAATEGTMSGLYLALAVGAMLFSFVSLVALLNGMMGGVGSWFGIEELSLQMILGYVFAPVAWLMGVSWDEAMLAGSFIGQKIVINEFFAYINLAPYLSGESIVEATGMPMSERTQVILSFALCGFANFGTVAIAIASIGGLVPERRSEIASLGFKALLAGVLSNLMAATIAGLFMSLG